MFIVPSFLESHGLRGVRIQDLESFTITTDFAYGVGEILAYLQLGLADTLHAKAAQHLGCAFFASFDSDFGRVRDTLKADFGLTLVSSPEELKRVLVG